MISSLDTAPTGLALHWDNEVKGHLRVDTPEERARVESVLIPAVTEWIQALTNRQLLTATWLFWYPSFAAACGRSGNILIPRPPLQSVTWVKYYDSQNAQQTLDPALYTVVKPAGAKAAPGWIQPVSSATYPGTYPRQDAVEIKAVCGYGTSYQSIPPGLRQAMLLLLAELFERREVAVTGTIVAEAPLGAISLGLPYLAEM